MTMRAMILAVCIFVVSSGPALAQDSANLSVAKPKEDYLLNGVCKYRLRQFSDAANDLGAALPSEFNNPLLHYYYANCMVHLRRKETAIREYRIAYALQPVGTIGDYCKQCLNKFGIDAEGKSARELKPPVTKSRTPDPKIPEPPSITELAALKANPKDGSKSAIEREKSVENLRNLMQQKKRTSGAPLPAVVGTNLYVRHYKETPAPKKKFGLWWW